eukprot:Skav208502  [mRNA]  locus=scaffold1658:89011:89676:- [translate_table: standard]
MVAGPPCETWSNARAQLLPGRARGPRPLRSLDSLWGLDSLSLNELAQVMLGNNLLGFTLIATVALAMEDGLAILEHPAEPQESQAPSIWRLPLVRMLLEMPSVTLLRFRQGLYGAVSPKPTNLLTVNVDKLDVELWDARVSDTAPANVSIGCTPDGGFKTAPLKPWQKAWAESLCKRAGLPSRGCAAQPDSFWEQIAPMCAFSKQLGADYAPQPACPVFAA